MEIELWELFTKKSYLKCFFVSRMQFEKQKKQQTNEYMKTISREKLNKSTQINDTVMPVKLHTHTHTHAHTSRSWKLNQLSFKK